MFARGKDVLVSGGLEHPVVDGRGHVVTLGHPPERIVSLVPSATETIHDFGCAERVVGITKWCVSPRPWVDGIQKVGGTKDVDIDRVRGLAPDLVVGNCEENTREIFEAIEAFAPVYAPFPRDVDQAISDIRDLARLLAVPEAGGRWLERIRAARGALPKDRFSYAYLIWRKPWMAVSNDTFIAAMLSEIGGSNAVDDAVDDAIERFPALSAEQLAGADPDVVLLSSEPMRFLPRHADELSDCTGLPRERFRFVDGAHCSWHGTRMAAAFDYLGRCAAGGFPEQP
jgi:ABC-type Fe3+-hydroxamate transport system substrate-binding protein